MADIFSLKSIAGTSVFNVDDSGNVTAAGTISTTGTDDFGASGIKADVIAESTAGAGVTIDGALIKDGHILDSVGFYDAAAPTKVVRLDAGAVTAGQTRVLAMPDANVTISAYAAGFLDDVDEATFKATVNLEPGVDVQAYSATLGVLAANARDALVKATVACANATGGATDALMSVQLADLGGTAITTPRQVLLTSGPTQYAPMGGPTNASLTLGTVTAGSVVATITAGAQWLVETDATGLFACTATDTEDGTLYFAAATASGGVSDAAKATVVVASNSDAAAWSA